MEHLRKHLNVLILVCAVSTMIDASHQFTTSIAIMLWSVRRTGISSCFRVRESAKKATNMSFLLSSKTMTMYIGYCYKQIVHHKYHTIIGRKKVIENGMT